MSTFSIKADLGDLDALIEADAAAVEAAARPAAQAGAQVLYDHVTRNVSRIRRKTGNLSSSIYQAYSDRASSPGHAFYRVSWNGSKAPHGHLVEFGHLQRYEVSFDPATRRFTTHKDRPLATPRQVAAQPFVRPAISSFPKAQDAMTERFFAELKARGVIR